MPPKAKAKTKPSKAEQAKKEKAAADLTFGLKNKNKSKKVQKFVSHVQAQTKGNAKGGIEAQHQAELQAKNEKKAKLQQAALLAALTKGVPAAAAPVEAGPTVEEMKEAQRIDMFTDPRGEFQNETMCRHFLEACESNNYGWFWICPNNGRECIYKHALDEGYILKKDRAKPGEEDSDDIAEKVDEQIQMLDATKGTPVNEETFAAWKLKIQKEREEHIKKLLDEEKKKKKSKKSDKDAETNEKSAVSGKDLFSLNPELFIDDASAMKGDAYAEDEALIKELRDEDERLIKEHQDLQRKMLDEAIDEDAFAEGDVDLEDLEDLDLEDIE